MKKVVVIDDDKEISSTLKTILKKEGFFVIPANSGEEGLRLIKSEKPDIILLDIMMPDIDGWAVFGKIKEDSSINKIPVIFLTGKTDDLSKSMGKKGADAYIEKPFDINDLIKTINKVIK